MNILLLLTVLATAANQQLIDSFDYPSPQAAQSAWVASSGTPQVTVISDGAERVLEFSAPFAADEKLERTILDRQVSLNLAAAGEFHLQIAAERPEACGHLTLYFRSGDGWYGCGASLAAAGWQTVVFPKHRFRPEGNPAGWQHIDGVRISVWRGQPVDSRFRLRRLAAVWHDVALVVPTGGRPSQGEEIRFSQEAAEQLREMLEEVGIQADWVETADLPGGALEKHPLAMVPYCPIWDEATVGALVDYLESGGRLFLCYSIPRNLAQALGIGQMSYWRPERRGALAEVRFRAEQVAGLPEAVRQASWNIYAAEPLEGQMQVIGWWYDQQGNPTGKPAMLIGARGAYFSHIVLSDDPEGKRQMLAAILGHLHPPLWKQIAEAKLRRAEQVGHCHDLDELSSWVRNSGNQQAWDKFRMGTTIHTDGKAKLLTGRSPAELVTAARLAQKARQAFFVPAYVAAFPSPNREGRAFWNHSGTGAYPGDWERTARELAEAGFNMVLPNMLWAGRAHYPSNVLPRSETFAEYGDQIAQCVAACHKYGIEVHVWKVNHNLSGAPRQFVEKLRKEGRLQMTRSGNPHNWLCPSHPANFRLEVESMLEVVQRYEVDGLHFDYIRYPNSQCCYCDGCRQRFEAELGRRVEHWPDDCYDGPLHEEYHNWRCKQITRLVEAVSREARKLRPGVKISAAVFGAYPECRKSVGQDWVLWIRAGYLDFVCPMDYTQDDARFEQLVRNQLKLVDGRIPVYPGIGAWRLAPDRVLGQIHIARSLGAAGFTVFNLTEQAASELLPVVAAGPGKQKAIPPHRK